MMMRNVSWLVLAVLVTASTAHAATLDRVREDGTFRIGFREDAAPFSYRNAIGEPDGLMVEMCRYVAAQVKQALELEAINVTYVPVTAADRFQALQQGRIDVLCGPTTVTLARRKMVDFSLFTFVDGASVLFRRDGPASFEELADQKVGVRAGTTTQEALNNTVRALGINVDVVPVDSHDQGLAQLEAGTVAAYFADRAILARLAGSAKDPDALTLSARYFTHEPYALALPLGDGAFRLLVDSTLARLYRSGAMGALFANAFGAGAEPTTVLLDLYLINSLPE